jgi:nucleoside-diphosphate-sugar epimerase
MDSCKTILITGAFGQVGQRCLTLLLDQGHKVIALDVANDKTLKTEEKVRSTTQNDHNFITIHANLLDDGELEQHITEQAPTVIIHLAAIISPPCYSNPALARKINVDGTATLIQAAQKLPAPPLFIFASSSAVYGSRNPHTQHEQINLATPVKPIECYGEDKIMGESLLTASGLPYAILRLAGVISPDGMSNMRAEYLVLVRATPRDNRVHAIDARDAALAFANAAKLAAKNHNKIFLIGGNDSCKKTQRGLEDDVMEVIGIGRLGDGASLPGNPKDDLGWSFTDWYDTNEAEEVLHFQQHDWEETLEWLASSINPTTRKVTRLCSPLIRCAILAMNVIQRKLDKRGRYADPWQLISQKYGDRVKAPCDFL